MRKYYNCTDGFLWKKGIGRSLVWISIGLLGYLIILILHNPIVNIKNSAITIIWFLFTLLLLVIWKKSGDSLSKVVDSWIFGYFGEKRVEKRLLKLNNSFCLLSDVRIPGLGGNIDFVVVGHKGIFAVEAKDRAKKFFKLSSSDSMLFQSRKQAERLKIKLNELGFDKITWVYPVVVLSNQKRIKNMKKDKVDILGIDSIEWYFQDYESIYRKNILTDLEVNEIAEKIYLLNHA